ncbi:hypothetical protein L210DRAFT_3500345 [Boletus edulis BED1]|uniref:Uncharacterized protein n=1 Tax=Boletus edulis BED1 TaxID=1328754 RepID=A0AAD4C8G3_BOLED|nr:hypothetical protein L210DRAFT_3500345 [Boletus edulis BED1]
MKVQSNLEQSDEKPAGVTEVISELRGDLEERRLPAERDRESLEGCLRVMEWWSNSRSCHRMSEDTAETGSEEVRRWAVKRTGERSENRKNVEQSSHNPGKDKRVEVTRSSGGSYRKNAQRSDAKAEKRESTELMSDAPEMDLNSLE